MGERLVQVGPGDCGTGEVGGGGRQEQGRVGGRLVTCGVEQPPQEGVHGVAEPGGAVLLQLLQTAHRNAARVAEVYVGGSAHVACELDQVALFQLEGEHGRVFTVQLLFFDEPGYVDEVRGVQLGLFVQPHQKPGQDRVAFDSVAAGHGNSFGSRVRLDRHADRIPPGCALIALDDVLDVSLDRALINPGFAGHTALLSQIPHDQPTEGV
ncbi:hypothetical protein ABZ307_39765 [Streptomyces griseorubiginosus]|uniref:hypothetical protein n=1 Tax=Streptomyces griseorubiginosus TaxID=67304 RepID=UPI0033B5BB3F